MALRKPGEIPARVGGLCNAEIQAFAHLPKSGPNGGFVWGTGCRVQSRAAVEHFLDAWHTQLLDVAQILDALEDS